MLIEWFDVPVDADEAFIADWERERGGATLYRAIRPDAPLRFMSVAPGDSHEVIHEDGDIDGPGGVTLIESFEARFVADWLTLRALFASQRGYLGGRLYSGGAECVGIVRWSSPLMRHRALQRPDVRTAAESLRSSPALYERVSPGLSGP